MIIASIDDLRKQKKQFEAILMANTHIDFQGKRILVLLKLDQTLSPTEIKQMMETARKCICKQRRITKWTTYCVNNVLYKLDIISKDEFKTTGGEVKVTQSSRDGGVDAVAFDPDPIRGGKIVIQAKRYTNTVGVSAVRDLYGTVLNEGATKGIRVTTANYGSDAYKFAKGKPLTLLNGSNLLYLLEKHGYHARIDLREAKKILAEQEYHA